MRLPSKITVLGTWLFAVLAGASAETRVGDRFPALPAGAPSLAGQVALIDFWASWCAPCKQSFPAYARLHADYAPRGLVLVAVSVDEKPAPYEAFVRQLAPRFTVLRDEGQVLVAQVRVPAMPTCYLLGRDGRVRYVHQGFHGRETDREIRREIDLLLAETISIP